MRAIEGEDIESRVAQLIKAWRIERGLSQQILADRAGMSKNAVSLYERGESSPSVHQIGKIVAALNLNVIRFLAGPNGFEAGTTEVDAYDIVEDTPRLVRTIECLLFDGVPEGGFDKENAGGVHEMPEQELAHDDIVVVRINNGMMYPTLLEGDLVLVDTRVKKPKSNAIVCALYKEKPIIARYRRQDRQVSLIPDNPRYEPVGSKRMRDAKILGEVVRLISRDVGLERPFFPV